MYIDPYYGCGEEYNVKKGKQYHLPYNIQAVGKNIKWGRGREFWEEYKDFRKWVWGRTSSRIELYTPL